MAAYSDSEKDQNSFAGWNKRGASAAFYHSNLTDRDPYLQRARDVSELTIPTLYRQEGENGASKLIIPWNSSGAYCVTNLASKLIFTMFPANRPAFLATQDKRTAADLNQLPPDQAQHIADVIRQGLSQLEQDVTACIDEDGDRAKMFVCALRLLVGGNHGIQFYDDGTIRGIGLENYVTIRDPQGNLLEFCIKDSQDWRTLADDVKDLLAKDGIVPPQAPDSKKTPVDIYTHGCLVSKPPFRAPVWEVHQEVCGVEVPGSDATYVKDALPYLFLPWLLLDGEHYGRSYVEFYEGDLLTMESLTKTIGKGSSALARLITLVSPTGLTNKGMIAKAKTGDVITGRQEDVAVITAPGKTADFSVAKTTLDDAIVRLSRAFLLNSSIQRGGERVTAEEIRYVSQELETALGGVYSQQVLTWQTPYLKLKIKYLQKNRRVTPLPPNSVKITVTGGLAALGRNADLTALSQGAALISQTYGPQAVAQYFKPGEFAARVVASLGINPTGLVPTEEELQQAAQQQQMQQLAQQLGPEALRQFGNNVTQNQVANTKAASQAPVDQAQVGLNQE